MRKIHRIFAAVLSAAFFGMTVLPSVAPLAAAAEELAEEDSPVLISVESVSCKAGETVSVPVTVTGNTGFTGTGISYSFDESFICQGIEYGLIDSAAVMKGEGSLSVVSAHISMDGANISGDGVLYSLELTVPEGTEPGSYAVDIEKISSFYDANFVTPACEARGGYITVDSETVTSAEEESTETTAEETTKASAEVTTEETEPEMFRISAAEGVHVMAGETAAVDISFTGNSGIVSTGIKYSFDQRLACKDVEAGLIESLVKIYGTGRVSVTSTSGTDVMSEDGVVYTLYISVPEDMPEGEYTISTDGVYSLSGPKGMPSFETSDGSIIVEKNTKTTTATTTTEPPETTVTTKSVTTAFGYSLNALVPTPDAKTLISVEKGVVAAPGETALVNVYISGNEGFSGTGIKYCYPETFKCEKVKAGLAGPMRSGSFGTVAVTSSNGNENIEGDGILYTLCIAVPTTAAEGEYPVEVSGVYSLSDEDINQIPFNFTNGSIIVRGESYTTAPDENANTTTTTEDIYAYDSSALAPDMNAPTLISVRDEVWVKQGSTAEVEVLISRNAGVSATGMKFRFNDAFTCIEAKPGLASAVHLSQSSGQAAVTSTNGNENIIDDGVLYTLRIYIPESTAAGEYPIAITAVNSFADADINTVPFNIANGSVIVTEKADQTTVTTEKAAAATTTVKKNIDSGGTKYSYNENALRPTTKSDTVFTVPKIFADPGTTVELPVYISGNPGFSATGLKFAFDESLECTKVVPGLIPNPAKVGGKKTVSLASTNGMENITEDGAIYTLVFKIPLGAAGGEYPVEICGVYSFSDSARVTLPFRFTNGSIIVRRSSTGSLKVEKTEVRLKVGDTYAIKANQSDLKYVTSDSKIASVSSKGIITALKNGIVVITATNKAGETAQTYVTVGAAAKLGDLNGDGNVTSEDATEILKVYADALVNDVILKAEDCPEGDFNNDNYVDSLDATAVLIDYAAFLLG